MAARRRGDWVNRVASFLYTIDGQGNFGGAAETARCPFALREPLMTNRPGKPRRRTRSCCPLTALCAAIVLLVAAQPWRAAAQSDQQQAPAMPHPGGAQVQVIPSQPRALPPPKKRTRGNALQIPALRQPAQPEASNPVHTIPQAFFGCWRGTSRPSDSAQYLGGCGRAYEIPETQELCFRRIGEGDFEIAFQSASSALANFRDHTELISSQGDRRVNLN